MLLTLAAAIPALADTQFRIRKMTRDDVPLGRGQCDIRLQIDGEAEVAVRGDTVSIRTISGRDGRDDGSECNAPLPRDPRNFSYDVRDSRGEIRLIAEPSGRGDAAVVRIRDSSGGEGRYHFRLSWEMGPGGDRPRIQDDFPRRDSDFPRRDNDRPDRGGGFSWNNAIHYSGSGRGESVMSGVGSQRLFNASVDIDRGGRIQVSFRTDSGRSIAFSGTVMGQEGDTLKADVAADDRYLRMRGPMYLSLDNRRNIYRISFEATNGRDRLHLNWDRR
jgi:hypothetical protein